MKRKRYEKPIDDFKSKILKLVPVTVLKCDVWGDDVMDFQQCVGQQIYCSYDCYAIIMLSLKRNFLDAKDGKKSFDENELMILEE